MPEGIEEINWELALIEWVTKYEGSLQRATEMNELVSSLQQNRGVLLSLLTLVGVETSLNTDNKEVIKAINELLIKISPNWLNMQNQYDIIPFPMMKKGETRIVRIYKPGTNEEEKNGWATIGGNNGVRIGHMAMIICMQNSDGGTFAEVGHKYAIIGNVVAKQEIITVENMGNLPDEHEADPSAIYLTLDTGNLYFFSVELGDYVQIGSVIEGEYVDETTFLDTSNNPVVPDGTHLYKDIASEVYYRWNGIKYITVINDDVEYPPYLRSQLLYGGTFNASTGVATLSNRAKEKLNIENNTITLANTNTIYGAAGNEGLYYICTTAGTLFGVKYNVNDWILSNGLSWIKNQNVTTYDDLVGAESINFNIYNQNISDKKVISNTTKTSVIAATSGVLSLPKLVAKNSFIGKVFGKFNGGGSSRDITVEFTLGNKTYSVTNTVTGLTEVVFMIDYKIDYKEVNKGQISGIIQVGNESFLIDFEESAVQTGLGYDIKAQLTGGTLTINSSYLHRNFNG